ncbi:helix-turn-helix domain-containing protein [Rhodococcus sp. 077-4]|uniref:helix-turn-helix domain-containing protein n=1 Tax=Rhodococcus sp. 077-4 TaxID=2789271 RepID=UPI0039F52D3E
MYRLAELDADSAGLVRVIDYFDALVRHGADTAAMMRASAALADCTVGMDVAGSTDSSRTTRRCDPGGRWSPQPQRPPSSTKDVVVDDVVVGTVWIERVGKPLPLDDMLVDRMAITAAAILHPRRTLTDYEHTTNLLFPMDELAVLTACAGLGIDPETELRVLVYDTDTGLHSPRATAGRAVAVTVDDAVVVPVVRIDEIVESTAAVGISLPSTASTSHLYVGSAYFARSQATEDKRIVDASELGALNLLAPGNSIPHESIPDLVRARQLTETATGRELLGTLRVYLRSGSLRAAANRMHLHHSSVAHRLAKLSDHLGYTVDAIENRPRAASMVMVIESRRPRRT